MTAAFFFSWQRWVLGICVAAMAVTGFAADEVEFFAAIDNGQIAATVIPRDANRLTIQVENKTDKPLTVKLPDAIAAMPVLAQQPFGLGLGNGAGLFGGNQGGGNQGAQGLGAPLGLNGGNNGGLQGGFFSIPPGKIIKQKLPCVCLEFGKPDPRPQMAYRIERLETLCDKPAVAELMTVLAQRGVDQQVVQIAAWHLANDMTWEQLAGLKHELANGRKQPRFSPDTIEQAMRLVQSLPAVKAGNKAPDSYRVSSR